MDDKVKDFSMTFKDLFKQIQDLLYLLKLECFTHFFQKSVQKYTYYIYKLYYSALLSWLNPNNEKQPMTDRFWKKVRHRKVAVLVLQCWHMKDILSVCFYYF